MTLLASMDYCLIWGFHHRSLTTHPVASVFGWTDRWTCVWIRLAAFQREIG